MLDFTPNSPFRFAVSIQVDFLINFRLEINSCLFNEHDFPLLTMPLNKSAK